MRRQPFCKPIRVRSHRCAGPHSRVYAGRGSQQAYPVLCGYTCEPGIRPPQPLCIFGCVGLPTGMQGKAGSKHILFYFAPSAGQVACHRNPGQQHPAHQHGAGGEGQQAQKG